MPLLMRVPPRGSPIGANLTIAIQPVAVLSSAAWTPYLMPSGRLFSVAYLRDGLSRRALQEPSGALDT